MYFVFDIDGTTSFNGLTIEPEICDAFRSLKSAGHRVVLASARPVRDMLPMLPSDLRDITCIGANGAIIYQDAATRVRASLAPETVEQIRQIIRREQLDYLADAATSYAFHLPDEHFLIERIDAEKIHRRVELEEIEEATKIIILNMTDLEEHDRLLAEIEKLDVEISHHDDPTGYNIDISARGINKQSAIEEVLDGAPYIAFGNDTNDLEMLAGASVTVAVGEKPEIVAVTDYQCPAEGNAVAQLIDRLEKKLKGTL